MYSTNYYSAFIEVAEDCPATRGEVPPVKGKPSVANLQYELLAGHPYEMTSDDLLFLVHARRNELPEADLARERDAFFSKGQPCLRASPLTKRYGWGIHSDAEGRVALYGVESEAYQRLVADKAIAKKKAMRSKRG